MTPMLVSVEMALLYHAVALTSEKLLVLDQYLLRDSSLSIRKKMVATSARVTLRSGCTMPSL